MDLRLEHKRLKEIRDVSSAFYLHEGEIMGKHIAKSSYFIYLQADMHLTSSVHGCGWYQTIDVDGGYFDRHEASHPSKGNML